MTAWTRREFLASTAGAASVASLAGASASARPDEIVGIVDAHVHVWSGNIRKYPLAPGFTPKDLWLPGYTPDDILKQARGLGVARLNLVQMTWYALDHSYILDVIAKDPKRFAGTGIVPAVTDVSGPSPDDTMVALSKGGIVAFRVRGKMARPPLGDGPQWLDHPGYQKMFKAGAKHNLTLSFLMGPEDLPELDRMCSRFPETPVIIDHLCGIGARGPFPEEEIQALCNMAKHPRLMVKIGAFYARGARKPPYLDCLPLIRRVVEAFSPDRCMWETDCPLTRPGVAQSSPPHTYAASLAIIRDHADFLSKSDKEKILVKTAEKLFFDR
ncbi:MAG: amidohydrolase [Acidimicrobiia bacterium]|nr:amidohydrolase [Acidimicrobiia bacterium]